MKCVVLVWSQALRKEISISEILNFQLHIPFGGIRFSEMGVCANGMMSHVETCCFEKRLWFDLLTALIGPQVYCALGVEKRVLPKSPGAWFLGFDFFSGQKSNVNNKHLTMY